jgi:pimeloyl-ACP methyl ester carboxylesterase
VVSYDHRGNGRSDRGDVADWNLDTWADDVKALCDALDIDQPIVLGWSFGSFVALRYATRYPDHPAKLILQSPALRMDVAAVIAAFETVGTPEQAAVARAFWTDPTPDAMAAYAEQCIPLYDTAPLGERLARTVLNFDLLSGFEGQTTMDLQADAASVRVPVLVAAGRLDPIMPISAATEVVAALSDVTFEIFEHSSHFIHSSEPDRYFNLLARFVTS